jgi:GDP-4-dehydro-6-deoxy-D-mannose reductase
MKAIVTGSEGFIGSYLINELLARNHEVIATYKAKQPKLPEKVSLVKLDILNYNDIYTLFDRQQPHAVFHLAAAGNNEDSNLIHKVNVDGTKNLIEAAEEMDKSPSLVIIGSAEEYGVPEVLPIAEEHPLNPLTPYAKSKALAENLAKDSAKKGFRVLILRSFDIIGPGQDESHIVSGIAKAIAVAEKGKKKAIEIENMHLKRDFTDVRDMAKAYVIASEKADSGEFYNICSGNSYEIKDIADRLLKLSKEKVELKEATKVKKNDVPVLLGDNRKFFKKTGWRPLIDIDMSLSDILAYWRKRV